jgi:hypothetical protein
VTILGARRTDRFLACTSRLSFTARQAPVDSMFSKVSPEGACTNNLRRIDPTSLRRRLTLVVDEADLLRRRKVTIDYGSHPVSSLLRQDHYDILLIYPTWEEV